MINIVWHAKSFPTANNSSCLLFLIYTAKKVFSMVTSANLKWRRVNASKDDQQALIDETWWNRVLAFSFSRTGGIGAPHSFSDSPCGDWACSKSKLITFTLTLSTFSLNLLPSKQLQFAIGKTQKVSVSIFTFWVILLVVTIPVMTYTYLRMT